MGRNAVFLYPTGVGGPSATLYTGRVVITIDPAATWTVVQERGTKLDICAELGAGAWARPGTSATGREAGGSTANRPVTTALRTPPLSVLIARMVMGVNTPGPLGPYVPFDLATVSGGGHRAATALDLDTMARIAEEAGRDAVRAGGPQAPFDANSALRGIPRAEGMMVTATRLYRACRRGATDPAID